MTPSRSGDSSEANGRLPSSLRSSDPRIGRSCSLSCSSLRGTNIHPQRIDDPIAGKGIDLEPQLVGRQHLLRCHVDIADALVDPHELLGERNAPGDAGARRADRPAGLVAVEDPHRLAEADDDRLLGFRDDRDAAEQHEQQQEGRDDGDERAAADEVRSLCRLPRRLRLLDLGQRQIGRHAGRLDDRLVDLREHLLHRFVIHAAAGHFGRQLVLLIDLVERGRLTLRLWPSAEARKRWPG